MATINSDAVPDIKAQIDEATSRPDGLPGVQFYAVNKNGDYIFEHASGKIGLGSSADMTHDHAFWMASCTKMVAGIACMQLYEQGVLALDDVEQVEKIAPELKAVQVIGDDGQLVPKKRGITLRMLLNHTAGFGYSFFNKKLMDHFGPVGLVEVSGRPEDYLKQPLVNQPGERWEYGINIDWAGILVMRVTGLTLEEYFKKHITGPLGIDKDISFLPDEQMRKDMTWCHVREPTGKLSLREDGQLLRAPLVFSTPEEGAKIFQAAGAGTFARPRAYCQIIATLLNDGVHGPSGTRILKKETIDLMFTNQIPEFPDFARRGDPPCKPGYANPAPEFYPEPGNPPQGWGLTFFLHLQDSGLHSKGTAWWAGLPNLFWWCDREKGIGGIIAAQIIPFGDLEVFGLWMGVESELYQNLVQDEAGTLHKLVDKLST